MVTLEGLQFNSSMISFHIWLFKKSIHNIAKQCSHVGVSLFGNGFTLEPMAQATLVSRKGTMYIGHSSSRHNFMCESWHGRFYESSLHFVGSQFQPFS
jgi:hypothetical protein